YLLLHQTLEDTDKTAIVKITLRTRTRLAILRTCGKLLMIQTLRWDDEIREVDFKGIHSEAKITKKEREMSAQLVESYAEDFTPEEFSDDYQVELRKLIDTKLEAGESVDLEEAFPKEEEEETEGDVVDRMEALRKSVDHARSTNQSCLTKSGKRIHRYCLDGRYTPFLPEIFVMTSVRSESVSVTSRSIQDLHTTRIILSSGEGVESTKSEA